MKARRRMKWTFVLGPVLGLVVIGGLVYWTWCWGLWGRGNLLLQALFQCRCPAASEDARYKPLQVIVPACTQPYLRGFSPSGRYLAVFQRSPDTRLIRVDLQTGETLDTGHTGATGSFVTDDLIITTLVGDGKGYMLIDLSDRTRLQLPEYDNFDAIVDKLRKAEKVFVTDDTYFHPYVVGLGNDYKNNVEDNVAMYWDAKTQRLFDRLVENGITYAVAPPPSINVSAPPNYYHYSLDQQRLYANSQGIYLSQTDQLIASSDQPDGSTRVGPKGWVLDNHAVVYGEGWYKYLIDNSQSPLFASYFPVPQPILLLEVPPQHWASDE